MTGPRTHFDGVAENFADYAETVRGYVRYELTKRNLAPFLGEAALTIADIGGGAGIDAAWLVEQGHYVTIVEPSAEQVAKAEERKAGLPNNQQSKFMIVHGTAEDLLNQDKADSFDLVLSHGVAMYVDEREKFIASLVALAKPGGYISLLEKGFEGQLERMHRQGKSDDEIAQFFESQTVPANNMNRPVRAFLPEELDELLRLVGAEAKDWSGVRITADTDTRLTSEVPEAELAAIVDTEVKTGRSMSSWNRGQMLHFIAQKHLS